MYKEKYLKYKSKYLDLKNQLGGDSNIIQDGGMKFTFPWKMKFTLPWEMKKNMKYVFMNIIRENADIPDKTEELINAFNIPKPGESGVSNLTIKLDSMSQSEINALITGMSTNNTITVLHLIINITELSEDQYTDLKKALQLNKGIIDLTIELKNTNTVPPDLISALNTNKKLTSVYFKNIIDTKAVAPLIELINQNKNIKFFMFNTSTIPINSLEYFNLKQILMSNNDLIIILDNALVESNMNQVMLAVRVVIKAAVTAAATRWLSLETKKAAMSSALNDMVETVMEIVKNATKDATTDAKMKVSTYKDKPTYANLVAIYIPTEVMNNVEKDAKRRVNAPEFVDIKWLNGAVRVAVMVVVRTVIEKAVMLLKEENSKNMMVNAILLNDKVMAATANATKKVVMVAAEAIAEAETEAEAAVAVAAEAEAEAEPEPEPEPELIKGANNNAAVDAALLATKQGTAKQGFLLV